MDNVVRDFKNVGRVTLVSFGVDAPLLDDNPKNFVLLSCSSHLDEKLKEMKFDCENYPEFRQATNLGGPIIARDIRESPIFAGVRNRIEKAGGRSIAVIPLYHRQKLFGMLKARLKDVTSEEAYALLSDLSSYSKDIAPFAAQYDYFRRIYRSLKKSA